MKTIKVLFLSMMVLNATRSFAQSDAGGGSGGVVGGGLDVYQAIVIDNPRLTECEILQLYFERIFVDPFTKNELLMVSGCKGKRDDINRVKRNAAALE